MLAALAEATERVEIAAAIHGYSELGVQHLMIQIAPYTPAALERLTEALHLFRSAASTN